MYKVVKYFTDLKDGNHAYKVGEVYPRQGVEPTQARIEELASNKNRQGVPLIAIVTEENKADVVNADELPKKSRKKKAEIEE